MQLVKVTEDYTWEYGDDRPQQRMKIFLPMFPIFKLVLELIVQEV